MIYITGDIHGDLNRIYEISEFCRKKKTTEKDIMILVGDVGVNYYNSVKDVICKDALSDIPITFICIRGNHEIRPENISTYKTQERFGDEVLVEDNYPNIIWLKDGHTYDIKGKKVLAIGGAYSVDKFYRLSRGWCWFPDEQLSEQEREEIYNKVSGEHFDVVLTHTCPFSWEPTELFLPGIDQSSVDSSTEHWLEKVKDAITYDKWFFGHFHGDKKDVKAQYEMLYNKISKIT